MSKSRPATIVILFGDFGDAAALIARDRVALDQSRRKLLVPGDPGYPSAALIATWTRDRPSTLAVVLTPDGIISDLLDTGRATSAAWVEDAFVRALREKDY
jgi:hypothetical protein